MRPPNWHFWLHHCRVTSNTCCIGQLFHLIFSTTSKTLTKSNDKTTKCGLHVKTISHKKLTMWFSAEISAAYRLGHWLGFASVYSIVGLHMDWVAPRLAVFGRSLCRALGTKCRLSVNLSVCPSFVCSACIAAKRYVVRGRRWYGWIGR